MDPTLLVVESELRRTGAVVVPHAEHVCVRLPLLASVVVRRRGEELACETQLGPFRRTTALVGTALVTGAGVAALAATGDVAWALTAGVGGTLLMLLELAGLVLAEGCTTRVQLLWAARVRAGGVDALPPAPAPAIGERALPGRP